MYNFVKFTLFLLVCYQVTAFHAGELQGPLLPTTTHHAQIEQKVSELELKQLGDKCLALPYVLWVHTLDFLLGPYHDVRYTIDPSIVDRWHQKENQLALDDCGRLISRYKDSLYSWIPHTVNAWKVHAIDKGWSFDRCDNDCIVLVDDDHTRIKTFDDASFKEQAEYKIDYDETLFMTAQRGKALIYGRHPLSVNSSMSSPIKNLTIIKSGSEATCSLSIPEDGIMPPIVVNDNGSYIAAHASTTAKVYIFAVNSRELMSTVMLSAQSVSTENPALWDFIDPKTQEPTKAYIMKQDGFVFLMPKKTTKKETHDYSAGLSFLQKGGIMNCMNFIYTKKKLLLTTARTNLHEISNIIEMWDITSGKQINVCSRAMEQVGLTREVLSRSGRLVTNNKCNGYDYSTSINNSPLRPLIPQRAVLISRVLISPSGDWVLCKSYIMDGDKELKPLPPQLCYLGGERMKCVTKPVPDAYRKFMMRLYALQRASELGEHTRLPHEMQKAIGMELSTQ